MGSGWGADPAGAQCTNVKKDEGKGKRSKKREVLSTS